MPPLLLRFLPDCRGEVVLRRFRAADELYRAVLPQQQLRRAKLAVVVVAHGVAVGPGVVDDPRPGA